jgi:Na+-translocating ferredoxin:NAD+ oxidoreductase RnfC subunit
VSIPLAQHIGAPGVPVVTVGQRVERGTCIADIPEGKLGARIHASITGIIKSIDSTIVIEQG